MEKNSLIYVAGHTGLIGSAIVRMLLKSGYRNLVLKTHQELDLTNQKKTEFFFKKERPEYIFLAAAKVGGILANDTYPADFIYQNTMILSNVIHSAYKYGVKKLLLLGSPCIYPKICPQPIREEYFLTGPIEPTNEPYAVAKIAGIKMCQSYNRQYGTDFICAIPANVYGINDNFEEGGHVVAGLIKKFHEAKMNGYNSVTVWGTGRPRREFLYVDDAAEACIFLMKKYAGNEIINIGGGTDISIRESANLIKKVVGFKGRIVFDATKPDGMPKRLLNAKKIIALGWKPGISLEEGLIVTYGWYKKFIGQKNK